MDFPIAELMDEDACYAKLLSWLHPDGLACPRCGARDGLGVHRRHRAPVLDYRCNTCERVFNTFTGTLLRGTQRRPVELDPPRRRANKRPGHGTWDNDRPPARGVVGRDSGVARLSVERHSDGATLNRVAREATSPPARVDTDEWRGYDRLAETGCSRAAVCHAAGEWARDDDGDGVREVHVKTQEGLWTGLRNFLRTFRGVSKKCLYRYVAIFEWGHNIKRVTPAFIRAVPGVTITTFRPP